MYYVIEDEFYSSSSNMVASCRTIRNFCCKPIIWKLKTNISSKESTWKTISRSKCYGVDFPALTYIIIVGSLTVMAAQNRKQTNKSKELDKVLLTAIYLPCCK